MPSHPTAPTRSQTPQTARRGPSSRARAFGVIVLAGLITASLLSATAASAVPSPEATFSATTAAPTANPALAPGAAVPVYRLAARDHADHAYTVSVAERDAAQTIYDYAYEGVAFLLYQDAAPGTTAIYRLVSPRGYHLMTWTAAERDAARQLYGFTYEGIMAYAPTDGALGAVPLHRLIGATGDYFYTMSASERDGAVANFGYTYEGPAGYVYPEGGSVPTSTGTPTPTPTATRTPSPTATSGTGQSPTPTSTLTPTATQPPSVSVNISDSGFSPSTLAGSVGATVTWTNAGALAHTATSVSGPQSFDTGVLNPGQSGSFMFTMAGTYNYRCTIHPTLTGSISVS